MDPTQQPSERPAPGITFEAQTAFYLESSLIVGIDTRVVEIVSIDCYPCSRFEEEQPTQQSVRAKINSAIDSASEIHVTIPEPTETARHWFRDLSTPTPKPGWVWIDSAETISDTLVGAGLRSATPDYPTTPDPLRPTHGQSPPRPATRPAVGLTLSIDRPVRQEGSPDFWRVLTTGGDELLVRLADCYCRPLDYDAYERAWDLMAAVGASLLLTLPRPTSTRDWLGSLQPGSEHAGWLWLDGETTLNERLVAEGHASATISR